MNWYWEEIDAVFEMSMKDWLVMSIVGMFH